MPMLRLACLFSLLILDIQGLKMAPEISGNESLLLQDAYMQGPIPPAIQGAFEVRQSWSQGKNIHRMVRTMIVGRGGRTIIGLHGHGEEGKTLRSFNAPNWKDYCLILPEAYKNKWNVRNAFGLNTFDGSLAPDVKLVETLIDFVKKMMPNCFSEDIIVLGFSNGCGLAHRVMIESDRQELKRFVCIGGQMNELQYDAANGTFKKLVGESHEKFEQRFPLSRMRDGMPRKFWAFNAHGDNVIPYEGGYVALADQTFMSAPATTKAWAKYFNNNQEPQETGGGGYPIGVVEYLGGQVKQYTLNGDHRDLMQSLEVKLKAWDI